MKKEDLGMTPEAWDKYQTEMKKFDDKFSSVAQKELRRINSEIQSIQRMEKAEKILQKKVDPKK